ncbi:MAG: nicotinamide mononucleotide transporter [Bacteroidetes bacterium]|nr:nicotinamide mononucleotide transporter [Bacteroidota bacterium]
MSEPEFKYSRSTLIEWLAVLLNLGFTILFQFKSPWAFACGVLGPLLLGLLSYKRKLFADVFLQLVYTGLAIYGYFQHFEWAVWPERSFLHVMGISVAIGFGWAMGYALKTKTSAALPYLDALITTFSLWATVLLMNGFESAWLYFIFINIVSSFMFYRRDLRWIGLLFVLYTVLAIQGYFHIFK